MRLRHIKWSVVHPISDKDLRYLSSSCHLSRMVSATTTFCACGLSSACRVLFVVDVLPHSWSMSGSMGRILNGRTRGLARRRIYPLFNCRFLSDGCKHLPKVQYTMPTSQLKEQSGHCMLEEIAHSSKYSVWPMLLINSFDLSLNWLKSSGLVQILHQRVTVRVCVKLVDQFLVHFLCDHRSSFWTAECRRPWILKSMLPLRVSSNFALRVSSDPSLRLLWWSSDALASKLVVSWRPWCKFGVSTVLRGNLGDWHTLLYKSSPVFMYTTFSTHIARQSVEKSDCVRSWLIELHSFPLSKLQIAPIFLSLGEYSKYSCFRQLLVQPGRTGLLLDADKCTPDSRLQKKTACPSLLRLSPPRISPHWMVECVSGVHPTQ